MSKAPDAAAGDPPRSESTPEPDRERGSRPWWHVGLPAALVVVLVLALVGGVVSYTKYRTERADEQDRQEVTAVAQQFALRLDAIDYKDLGAYQKGVEDLLTTKMKSDFKQNYSAFAPAFKAIEITSKGEVRAAGVQDIDQDSATVLVIHDVDVTAKGCVQPPYKRMKVELQKVQGTWLVSDFTEDVPGCQG